MTRILLLLAGALLPVLPAAAEPESDPRACEDQQGICASDCGEERFLGFLRSAASDRCVLRCERKLDACLAVHTDVDRFEVILGRKDTARRAEPAPEPVSEQREQRRSGAGEG